MIKGSKADMDYSEILHALNTASLFDLYRLRAAIDKELDNPARINEIRARLKPGMVISYFEPKQNRLIEATVLNLQRTYLLVENLHDHQRWNVKFAMVNLANVPTDIRPIGNTPINKNLLKVGDHVGFVDKSNNEHYGKVIKLNPTTAAILTNDGHKWRVDFKLLFQIVDANEAKDELTRKPPESKRNS
jgi:hypothetical protein